MSHFYIAANPTPSVPECPAGLSSHTDPFGCAFTHIFINIDDSCPNIPKDQRDCRDQKCGGPGVYWVLKGSEERIPKEMCCEDKIVCEDQCADKTCIVPALAEAGAYCKMNPCHNECKIEWFLGVYDVSVECGGSPPNTAARYGATVKLNRAG
ncbi:hypothetical protein EB796_001962 [Bugula neritina]|uniref:Uncharacterized protein n=1 Tax=Bugula neritina TaxID=10212 RepID=A0A7J7KNH4_BUGNE|nr:hypothetical protein EB796_001962 [Bugula neritina]